MKSHFEDDDNRLGPFFGLRNVLILYAILGLTIFFAVKAFGSPYLVCDPQAGVSGYEVDGLGFGESTLAEADGSIRLDLAPLINPGDYSINVRACNMWGCSADTPFTFTRSPNPVESTNIRLEP